MNDYARAAAYKLIYAGCEPEPGRFTSDLPINSEVWLLYAADQSFDVPKGLLLTPHNAVGVAGLRSAIARILPELQGGATGHSEDSTTRFLAVNESHVYARVDFFQLLALLPLTRWWTTFVDSKLLLSRSKAVHGLSAPQKKDSAPTTRAEAVQQITAGLEDPELGKWLGKQVRDHVKSMDHLQNFKQIGLAAAKERFSDLESYQQEAAARIVNVAALYVGLTLFGSSDDSFRRGQLTRHVEEHSSKVLKILAACFAQNVETPAAASADSIDGRIRDPLWQVSCNRQAQHAVYASRKTIKADAAIRVFDTGGQGIRWAIIDSGIDARHPALADSTRLTVKQLQSNGLVQPSLSRVVRTLDFSRLAAITSGRLTSTLKSQLAADTDLIDRVDLIARDLANGRMIDWARIEPLLEVDHGSMEAYERPVDSHGTHVAGIIGADWRSSTYLNEPVEMPVPTELVDSVDLCGICPRIELLDLRVFSRNEGADEFAILAALQYVRYLNQSKDRQYVHGVNLSLSLRHDVRNYACGSTPVCLECDRLVGNGVLVVAAAGNFGYDESYGDTHLGGAYRGQSITDPGNAASVLTVGATHRTEPYQYGISYFSSHGPTGDGRNKPDVVAPGEKIVSTVPEGGVASMDGTSMAAPHVSGVAALLLSRNYELMGQPERLRRIICDSASDLGRDKVFQGAGLVDALRALQTI
jgi:subtilisin family serine protease